MPAFTRDQVFILPHAQEYARLYEVSAADILACLNTPDTQEGLANDHYTAEKQIGDHHAYVYYYLTAPLQGKPDEYFAIIDFIGYTAPDDQPSRKENREGTHKICTAFMARQSRSG